MVARIVALCLLILSRAALAEWEGVASEDYWWPYNLYLALIWIGLPLYVFAGWLRRRWRDRKALKELEPSPARSS